MHRRGPGAHGPGTARRAGRQYASTGPTVGDRDPFDGPRERPGVPAAG